MDGFDDEEIYRIMMQRALRRQFEKMFFPGFDDYDSHYCDLHYCDSNRRDAQTVDGMLSRTPGACVLTSITCSILF